MHVDEDDLRALAADPRNLALGDAKRIVDRVQEHAAHHVDHADPHAVRRGAHARPHPRRALGVIRRAQQPRLVADVRTDRPAVQTGQSQLAEAAVREVAGAYDADRRQVARLARLLEVGLQLVNEALRQGVPGA